MDKNLAAYREIGAKRYRETSGLYYEDFDIGDTFEHPSRSNHHRRRQHVDDASHFERAAGSL